MMMMLLFLPGYEAAVQRQPRQESSKGAGSRILRACLECLRSMRSPVAHTHCCGRVAASCSLVSPTANGAAAPPARRT